MEPGSDEGYTARKAGFDYTPIQVSLIRRIMNQYIASAENSGIGDEYCSFPLKGTEHEHLDVLVINGIVELKPETVSTGKLYFKLSKKAMPLVDVLEKEGRLYYG